MKAAFIEAFGSFEKIKIGELPLPPLKENEVLVKVSAVSVNHVDTFIRSGSFPIKTAFPFIIGRDAVGEVVAVGKTVKKFKKGMRVWTNGMGYENRQGVTSEYAAIPEAYLFPIPREISQSSFEKSLLASVHSSATAAILLQNVQPQEKILITGAAGHVGKSLVSLSHLKGLLVTTTSSEKDFPDLQNLGAEKTYSYGENFSKNITEKFDYVVDTSGKVSLEEQLNLLHLKGAVWLITTPKKSTFDERKFYTSAQTLRGFVISRASLKELQEAAEVLNQYFVKGFLLEKDYVTYPVEKAAFAHQLVEKGLEKRKILLTF